MGDKEYNDFEFLKELKRFEILKKKAEKEILILSDVLKKGVKKIKVKGQEIEIKPEFEIVREKKGYSIICRAIHGEKGINVEIAVEKEGKGVEGINVIFESKKEKIEKETSKSGRVTFTALQKGIYKVKIINKEEIDEFKIKIE